MTRLLGGLGYRVTSFTDPVEALEAFRAQPESFDVVLSDFTMPGLDGLELARQLTSVRPVPIVLTSGLLVDRAPAELAALGVRAVLQKPVAINDVAAALRGALAH